MKWLNSFLVNKFKKLKKKGFSIAQSTSKVALLFNYFQVELEFKMLVIEEREKSRGPWEKPSGQGWELTANSSTCDTRSGNHTQVIMVGGEGSHPCASLLQESKDKDIIFPCIFKTLSSKQGMEVHVKKGISHVECFSLLKNSQK